MRGTLSLSVQSCYASGSNGLTCLRGRKRCRHSCGKRDLIGVAKFVTACLRKMNPSYEGQSSDQPGVAGRDVI